MSVGDGRRARSTLTGSADDALTAAARPSGRTPRGRAHRRRARPGRGPPGRRPLPVPAGKTTELLVRLALDAGAAGARRRLIEDLWGEAAPARNTLQSKVSQLRRALGDPGLVGAGTATATRLELDPGGGRRPPGRPSLAGRGARPRARRRPGHGAGGGHARRSACSGARCWPTRATGRLHRTGRGWSEVRLGLLEDRGGRPGRPRRRRRGGRRAGGAGRAGTRCARGSGRP